MTTFRYKGVSKDGVKVSGTIKSYNEYEAVSSLRDICSIITKIEEVPESLTEVKKAAGKINERQLAIMCSQFSIILSSGLSLVRCVQMVAEQAADKEVRKMLNKVAEDISTGMSIAQAFEHNGPALPRTFIETVRAGEKSGTLEMCFKRLQTYYDKSSKTKAKIISTMTYPVIVIFVAIIVFIIIMTVAVPLFTETFESFGVELPEITKGLIAVSDFITGFWWLIVLIIASGVAVDFLLRRLENWRRTYAEFRLKKSLLHKMTAMNASAQFASTMSTMLAAGLPITQALEVTSTVIGNYCFSLAIRQVKEGVEQGRTVAESMQKQTAFPKMLTEMTGVGESSGSMEETLDVISEYFGNELDLRTTRLLAILEPAITVGLAVMTVILLLAVYLPMFSMYSLI